MNATLDMKVSCINADAIHKSLTSKETDSRMLAIPASVISSHLQSFSYATEDSRGLRTSSLEGQGDSPVTLAGSSIPFSAQELMG